MNEFQKQFEEVQDLLRFGDYSLVVKRIIDFTLDTQSVEYYKKGNALLDWLDVNDAGEEKPAKLQQMLDELHGALINKPVALREKILDAVGVTKQYGANAFALGPVNLELYAGDIIGLVGENGNGKTTLLRVLSGELHATSGVVKYAFANDDLYDLRTRLVYIPQRTDTWKGPMFENLVFTASTYGYTAEENELVVNLVVARLGLRKYRYHSWKNLSSGYKMRFELARMLLRKPKVLLIDEPLANLDILAQQTVLEDFRSIAKSPFRPVGIILSSRQLYEVEKTSSQVIFLKLGAQKNLYDTPADSLPEVKPLVVEFESEWGQSALNEVFSSYGLSSIQFNGSTYIATFNADVSVFSFMQAVIDKKVPIAYFRNISNSTRRFFVS